MDSSLKANWISLDEKKNLKKRYTFIQKQIVPFRNNVKLLKYLGKTLGVSVLNSD